MNNVSPVTLVLGAVLGLGLCIGWWLRARKQERKESHDALEPFAWVHGLVRTAPDEVSGVYARRTVKLRADIHRHQNGHEHRTTHVSVDVSDVLPREFSLRHAGLGDAVAHLAGGPGDAKLGYEGFDKAFSLENLSPEAREVLDDAAVMEGCWRLAEHEGFHIQEGWLHVAFRSIPPSVQGQEELLDSVLEATRALEASASRVRARRTV